MSEHFDHKGVGCLKGKKGMSWELVLLVYVSCMRHVKVIEVREGCDRGSLIP